MTDSDGGGSAGAVGPSLLRPYVSAEPEPAADGDPASASPPAMPDGVARLPPYLLTGGRARPVDESLEMEAQILATPAGRADLARLSFENRDIVGACRQPLAVAEVAARLGLQLGVTRVLVSDLVTTGHLTVRRPESDPKRRAQIIERVIRGLERID